MANAKEIKRRIGSIKNTAQITKAMELISTVKMKKAQDSANAKKLFVSEAMKVFYRIEDGLSNFALFKEGHWDKTLWVVITSNKGLCGGYNVNVMKKINSYMEETGEEIDFVWIWKRGSNFVAKTGNNLIADFSDSFSDNIEASFSKDITALIVEKFMTGEYKKVVVFYNYYVNTMTQLPVARKFLEISKEDIISYFKQVLGDEDFASLETELKEENLDFDFEPNKEELAEEIVPFILDMMLFDIILSSKASEHSSRMIAMKSAKDNANKYAKKLTLQYNKARQAAITTEISEISAGAEAMKD